MARRSGGSLPGITSTPAFLLAYSLMRAIDHQDEKLIGRTRRWRLIWGLAKVNKTFKGAAAVKGSEDEKIKNDIDHGFKVLNNSYIPRWDEDPNFSGDRSLYELALNELVDQVMELIIKHDMFPVSQVGTMLAEDFGGEI